MPAWLIWLIASGALAAAETTSLSFVLIMAAGGAAAGAITAAAGGPVVLQLVVAIVATLGLLWLARPVAIRHMNAAATAIDGTAALVGETAIVLARVTEDDGRVRLRGGEWSARAMDAKQDLPAGTKVTVVAIDGATAVVWQDPLRT